MTTVSSFQLVFGVVLTGCAGVALWFLAPHQEFTRILVILYSLVKTFCCLILGVCFQVIIYSKLA